MARMFLDRLLPKSSGFVRVSYGALALAVIAYIILTLLAPTDEVRRTYQINDLQVRLLQLTIVVPIALVWTMALWGSLRFREYAHTIKQSADGRALKLVAGGLVVLVAALVSTSVMQSGNHLVRDHSSHINAWVVSVNALSVALSLVAFGMIMMGATALARLVGMQGVRRAQLWCFAVIGIMGAIFAWVLATNGDPTLTSQPPYYLSVGMILSVILLPYLLIWYAGIMAVVYLRSYQQFAKGIIYRSALRNLSWGLLAIIGASLMIQLITAVSLSLENWGLTSILLLYYVLILVYAFGHILVVLGARRLSRIEEVR